MVQVYAHGLGQTPASWDKVFSLMNDNAKVVCPDLSDIVSGEDVCYASLYSTFDYICSNISEPIDLCGLSLGGVIALNYAIEHPDKVNSLVLIAAQYKMPKALLRIQNIMFRLMPKSGFQGLGFGKADFISLCDSMVRLDFSGSLDKVACPVLVAYGERDDANKKASVKLAGLLKNAELREVRNSGHQVNLDAPEETAAMLREFFEKNSIR